MNSLKCTRCGLVYLTHVGSCPRCGTSHEGVSYEAAPPGEKNHGSLGALAALVVALLLVAGGVFYYLRPAKTPAYAGAIRASEQFKMLPTVRVNRNALAEPNGSPFSNGMLGTRLGVTPAACVLEARGLLAFETSTTEVRSKFETPTSTELTTPNGAKYYTFGKQERELLLGKQQHLAIRVTPVGEKEAAGWVETEEQYNGREQKFWRVPIGEAEFVGVQQVLEEPGEGGKDKLTVMFSWRLRPNWLGQAFDAASDVMQQLPSKARGAANGFGFDSRGEQTSTAQLERVGGVWRVKEIDPPVMSRLAVSEFIPVD